MQGYANTVTINAETQVRDHHTDISCSKINVTIEFSEKFPSVGQNIAKAGGVTDDKEIVEKLANLWFDSENQNGYIAGWMDMINDFQDSPDP